MPVDEAKDVVAETFLVAWRKQDSIPDDPVPWLLSVARNVLATKWRATARRARLLARLEREDPSDTLPQDERRELVAGFMELSEKDREVLMLVGWDGLTVAEAAASLGWPPSRFSVRLHRARRRLEARMGDGAQSPFLSTSIPTPEETR